MKNSHTIFLILAVSVTIFVGCIYAYMYRMIDDSVAKTAKADIALNSAVTSRAREQSFLRAYEATASKWASLPDFFVHSDQVVGFIEKIESLGKESGGTVSISSINADDLDNSPQGTEGAIRLHVGVVGSWQAVMKTLVLAETLPYKVEINNVSAVSGSAPAKDKAAASKVWNISFDMQVAMIAEQATTSPIK